MNADNMPIANQEKLNQEDCSKTRNQSDLYSQNGNHGISHMSGGEIKDYAKVVGKEENNHNQSQNTKNQVNVNISTSSESNSLKKQNNLIDSQNTIEMYIKEGDKEASIKTPYSAENFQSILGFLQQRFNDNSLEYEDIKKSSIKLIIKGSEEGFNNIINSFESGELAPLLKQQFNLELEDVKLINSDSSENYQKDRSQKLLAFTIAGDVSQADIDILKAALIDTSKNIETRKENIFTSKKAISKNKFNNSDKTESETLILITYTDYNISLETSLQSSNDYMENLLLVYLRSGLSIYVESSEASIVVNIIDIPNIDEFLLATQNEENISATSFDDEYIEINFSGRWIAETKEKEEGLFLTSCSHEIASFLYNVWQKSTLRSDSNAPKFNLHLST